MTSLVPILLQASTSPPPGRGLMITLWYVVGFGAIFYFFFIRPQRKQQKQHDEMIQTLQKGDEVVTAGGLVGEIVRIKENRVTIQSGESRVVVERNRIARVGGAEAAQPEGGK